MAFQPAPVFSGSDIVTRSVWVVVEPRDVVTEARVPVPLEVELKDQANALVATKPIAGRSGVYCFTDLKLAAGKYVVHVRPLKNDRGRYFDAQKEFSLTPIPDPAQPLNRNAVSIDLLPRPGYPFDAQSTLARGRLVQASDPHPPIADAQVFLILDSVETLKGRTDERGEFVVSFPRTPPEDTPSAGLKEFKFKLRFEISPGKSHTTVELTVKEGTAKSINETFPGT